jgi:hypothetical protein
VFAYSANYLIDLDHAIIVDVEPSSAIRTAEAAATKTMIERTETRFDLYPERLAGDMGYGSGEMLGWLVEERGIEPHIPVWDRSRREDGTFSREDFTYDNATDTYTCPEGRPLTTTGRVHDGRTILYRAAQHHCDGCPMKQRCCPNTPHRRIPRDIHEGARDLAREIAGTDAYYTSRRQRKKVEMLFAHLKRILRLGRLRLRGPTGAATFSTQSGRNGNQWRPAEPAEIPSRIALKIASAANLNYCLFTNRGSSEEAPQKCRGQQC